MKEVMVEVSITKNKETQYIIYTRVNKYIYLELLPTVIK